MIKICQLPRILVRVYIYTIFMGNENKLVAATLLRPSIVANWKTISELWLAVVPLQWPYNLFSSNVETRLSLSIYIYILRMPLTLRLFASHISRGKQNFQMSTQRYQTEKRQFFDPFYIIIFTLQWELK